MNIKIVKDSWYPFGNKISKNKASVTNMLHTFIVVDVPFLFSQPQTRSPAFSLLV